MKIYRVMFRTDASPDWEHDTRGQRAYFKLGHARNAMAQKQSRDRWYNVTPRPVYRIESAEIGEWGDVDG